MSDSSEDEDLSRFKEAVDTSFAKLIYESRGETVKITENGQLRSERYLDVSSHYNDVRVPKEMQRYVGNKISLIIDNLVEYVDIKHGSVKQHKIKGGIKLFKDSEGFLSSEEVKDTFTQTHNRMSKKLKRSRKKTFIDSDTVELSESDKIKAAVVTSKYVLSRKETQHWKSRRKEKLFKYKTIGKNKNMFIAV